MGAKIAATKYLQNLKRRIVRERLTFRVVWRGEERDLLNRCGLQLGI
jgi:hypothetical protein